MKNHIRLKDPDSFNTILNECVQRLRERYLDQGYVVEEQVRLVAGAGQEYVAIYGLCGWLKGFGITLRKWPRDACTVKVEVFRYSMLFRCIEGILIGVYLLLLLAGTTAGFVFLDAEWFGLGAGPGTMAGELVRVLILGAIFLIVSLIPAILVAFALKLVLSGANAVLFAPWALSRADLDAVQKLLQEVASRHVDPA